MAMVVIVAVIMAAISVIMRMVVMFMIVMLMAVMRVGMFSLRRPQQLQKRAALHPQQPQANDDDQRIADDLDDANRVAHCFCGRAEQNRENADNGDGGESLKDRRRERQGDTALPGL